MAHRSVELRITTIVSLLSSPQSVFFAYKLIDDVGLYSYGGAHPMKPYRMRMTHHLVAAYDMLQQMDVFVGNRRCYILNALN